MPCVVKGHGAGEKVWLNNTDADDNSGRNMENSRTGISTSPSFSEVGQIGVCNSPLERGWECVTSPLERGQGCVASPLERG